MCMYVWININIQIHIQVHKNIIHTHEYAFKQIDTQALSHKNTHKTHTYKPVWGHKQTKTISWTQTDTHTNNKNMHTNTHKLHTETAI